LAVPASLHVSLMARLDRLGPAKEVVQIGAAIGREFSHSLLASVVRKPEAELASALNSYRVESTTQPASNRASHRVIVMLLQSVVPIEQSSTKAVCLIAQCTVEHV
jgi:predicted ATPase